MNRKRKTQIKIYLTPALESGVRATAAANDESVAHTIRRLIRRGLAAEGYRPMAQSASVEKFGAD